MSNKDEAMKLALEALDTTESECGGHAWEREQEAITAVREALAEQTAQQGPVTSAAKGAIMAAAYDFRDAHISGSTNLKRSAHAALEAAVDAAIAPQPAQQEPVALRDALASALTSVYVCGRVWSAWGVGTMSKDDFSPASECDEVLDELVSAVASVAPQPAQRKPLTEDEIADIAMQSGAYDEQLLAFARAIEAHYGIKENA